MDCLCTQLVANQLSVCVTCIVNAGSPHGPDLVTAMNGEPFFFFFLVYDILTSPLAYFSECSNNDIILTHAAFPTSRPRTTAAVSTARGTNSVTALSTPSSAGSSDSRSPFTSEAISVQATMRLSMLVLSGVMTIALIIL